MEKYYNKQSFFSKIVNASFKFTNAKKIYSSEEKTKKLIEKLSKKKFNSKKMFEKNGFIRKESNIVYYCYNGDLNSLKSKVIVYIHGGSFIENIISFQLKFAMKIAKKSDSTLIIPMYPLLPTGNYRKMYEAIYPLYNSINSENINLLGDSAGGGFILSFAMYLREKNINSVKNVIMMSPWLDVSMSNPDLQKSEKLDSMCAIEGNKYAGRLWANDIDTKNYLVSPIYGNFYKLPLLTIITGTRDILQPDCKLLSNKLNMLNINHNYIEYKNQGHDFGAYPTKEGKLVIDDIVQIINGGEINDR